jgi:hypothetical protein
MQTEFEPILVKQGNLVAPDLALGIYAEIAAPEAGTIGSIAVRLHNADAVGEMVLSVINPQVSYEGFFLYAFIEGILPATQGPSMYRKTEVHNGGYSTLTFGEGKLYALILPPKQAEPFTLPVLADVAISADTI